MHSLRSVCVCAVPRLWSMRSHNCQSETLKIEKLCLQFAESASFSALKTEQPLHTYSTESSVFLFVTVHLNTNDDTVWELQPVVVGSEVAHRNQPMHWKRSIFWSGCVPRCHRALWSAFHTYSRWKDENMILIKLLSFAGTSKWFFDRTIFAVGGCQRIIVQQTETKRTKCSNDNKSNVPTT